MDNKYETLKKLRDELAQAEATEKLLEELWQHLGPYGRPDNLMEGIPQNDVRQREIGIVVGRMLPKGFMSKLQRHFNFDDSE